MCLRPLSHPSGSGSVAARVPAGKNFRHFGLASGIVHAFQWARMSDPAMNKCSCHECGKHLKYPAEYEGTEIACPHCGKNMLRFRYRGWPLEIERCPDEEGYWLDKGEEKHISDYMKERKSRLSRASSAEASFARWRDGGGGGIIQKIKNIFR